MKTLLNKNEGEVLVHNLFKLKFRFVLIFFILSFFKLIFHFNVSLC